MRGPSLPLPEIGRTRPTSCVVLFSRDFPRRKTGLLRCARNDAADGFVMCSTFKASLAACVLARVDRGEDQLAAMIPYGKADLLEYAPVAKQNLSAGAMSV